MSDQRQCILLNCFKTLSVGPAGNWTRAWHSLVSYLTSGAHQSVLGSTVQLNYHIKKNIIFLFLPSLRGKHKKGRGRGSEQAKGKRNPLRFPLLQSPTRFGACFFLSCIHTSKLSLITSSLFNLWSATSLCHYKGLWLSLWLVTGQGARKSSRPWTRVVSLEIFRYVARNFIRCTLQSSKECV